MKFARLMFVIWIFSIAGVVALMANQPQTQTAPLYAVNAQYANGVAPGYWATQLAVGGQSAATGLNVNLGPGTANCGSGSIVSYSGGTFALTANATNYIYLNTSASCVPAIKTSAFVAADIPIAVIVTGPSTITSITDDRTMFNVPGNSGGGSGPFPANAIFVGVGSSMMDDDLHVLSAAIQVVSTFAGSTMQVNTSAVSGLHVGDWVSMRFVTNFGTQPVGTGTTLFQVQTVQDVGPTNFTINIGSLGISACGSSCGNAYSAMSYNEYAKVANPGFPVGALNVAYECAPTTIHLLATNFTSLIANCVGSTSGKVPYVSITNWNNDAATCRTAAQIEGDLQTAWTDVHGINGKVAQQTATGANWPQNTLGCSTTAGQGIFDVQEQVETWMRAQACSVVEANAPTSTACWDIIEDIGPPLTNAGDTTLIAANTGFGPQGAALATSIGAAALLTNSGAALPRNSFWWRADTAALPAGANYIAYVYNPDSLLEFSIFNASYNRIFSVSSSGDANFDGVVDVDSMSGCPGGYAFCAGGTSTGIDHINWRMWANGFNVTGSSPSSGGVTWTGGSGDTSHCWNTAGGQTVCGGAATHGVTLPLSPNGVAASPSGLFQTAPFSYTITACNFTTTTSDGSTALVLNVKFNGTSILSGSSATISAGTSAGTVTSLTLSGSPSITAGQNFELDVTSGTSSWTGAVSCHS